MKVERPQTDSLILEWMELFWTGVTARHNVMENEPNSGCLTWLSGAMMNASMLQGGTLKFGQTYTNLPPAGALNCDYILSGYVSNSGSRYEAVLTLETGTSRELVKSTSVQFDNTYGEPWKAGEKLAAQFGSILDVIRQFEIYKRDTDNSVAIRSLMRRGQPDEVKVTPSSRKVNAGDTVDVEISLIDCDGVPLKGRILHLKEFTEDGEEYSGPQNGKFTEDEITTDEQGTAKTRFVPFRPGLAVLYVNFLHKKPTGAKDLFIGTAYLNVPPETCEMDAVWNFSTDSRGDTSWTNTSDNGTLSFNSNTSENTTASFRLKLLLGRDYSIQQLKIFKNVLSAATSGTYSLKRDFFKDFSMSAGGTTGKTIDINNENVTGRISRSDIEANIIYPYQSDGIPEVYLSSAIARRGTNNTRNFSSETGWSSDSYDINDSSDVFSMDFNTTNMEDKTVKRTGDAYTYEFNIEKEYAQDTKFDYHGHTVYTREKEEWYISINPYGDAADVEKEEQHHIPAVFALQQNYPNPFNPSTVIGYYLPSDAEVSLTIYDMLGRQVKSLINRHQTAGKHAVQWNGSDESGHRVAGGIYYYRLKGISATARQPFDLTYKMIYMK
ncbi:MAG TPA: FlgD immunoglobulin-like domain containing protein [Ignavibacteriales bacterium]|nr:FlgD immunoglobulin-like domain containing protein [Ignavibacteriales bacterium]